MRKVLTLSLGLLILGLLGGLALVGEPDATWWSFRPLRPVVVPVVADAHNPIDSFIQARLSAVGLAPNPEADRRTLLRRLSLDLIGLPPTPEELADFESDRTPDAYERQVERLLASPHHGERWARHWLDTVHFAETHGHDQDRVRPHAWRYRDYLIDAFNRDRPYARFVEEQLAVDALYPDAPERIPALGLLAAGPWDESSLRDIREDSIDRKIGHYLDRDDMVMTAMTTFQSLSVHCARCHDHKLDPIDTADYYALQAVFAGIGRGEVNFEVSPLVRSRRVELQATLQALDRNDPNLRQHLLAPETRRELATWEEAIRPRLRDAWIVLNPRKLESTEGATLTGQEDGSVLSAGKRPDRDTYRVTARLHRSGLTAIRLEVLTDPTLPHHGPGRQDNGNLHLSEFRITAASQSGGTVGPARPLTIRRSRADHDQQGWTLAHAIDGNPRTAWGIYPQVGRDHEAIFELSEPLPAGDWGLTFALDQLHGGGHLVGRFRLSATNMDAPLTTPSLPSNLAAQLKIPAAARSEEQWLDLARTHLREKSTKALAALPPPQTVYAASPNFRPDGSHKPPGKPRAVHTLRRGDIHRPGAEARAGTVACLPGLPSRFELPADADEGARRAALAKWITRPDNPLTWRSIVNRVWHYHFGRGLVDTPGEFGKLGSKPSHPDLLDWLAIWFRDRGGSLKDLHRLIVTSATYRQTSRVSPRQCEVDADNRWLSRMPRTRLDAEQTRDVMLQVSGRLDRSMGGPSDQQFEMRPGIHVTPIVEYGKFNWDRPEGHRRGIYRFVFRTLPDPLVECLDGPDASQLTPVRNVSVTAPQALALLNNEFVLAHAQALATQVQREEASLSVQIERVGALLWLRNLTAEERSEFAAYAQKHGLANLCRVLMNSNEFLFVD